MKVLKLGENGIVTLRAQTEEDVVWLTAQGLDLRIKGDRVEATVAVQRPAKTAAPVPVQAAPVVPVAAPLAVPPVREEATMVSAGCAVAECPINRGGQRHYHWTPEGLAKRRGTQRAPVENQTGVDASGPKANPSGSALNGSGGPQSAPDTTDRPVTIDSQSPTRPSAPVGGDIGRSDRPGPSPYSVGTEVNPFEDAKRLAEEPPSFEEPRQVKLRENEAILTFRTQWDGRRVAHLESGRVVLVDLAFRETVQDGETWKVRIEHLDTFAKAFPLRRIRDKQDPAPAPVQAPAPRPERPADLPRPVTTPPQEPKPRKVDPMVCLDCGQRKAILGDGGFGHKSEEARALHNRMVARRQRAAVEDDA